MPFDSAEGESNCPQPPPPWARLFPNPCQPRRRRFRGPEGQERDRQLEVGREHLLRRLLPRRRSVPDGSPLSRWIALWPRM